MSSGEAAGEAPRRRRGPRGGGCVTGRTPEPCPPRVPGDPAPSVPRAGRPRLPGCRARGDHDSQRAPRARGLQIGARRRGRPVSGSQSDAPALPDGPEGAR
ncbi:hypothetical protein VULLAG_LOCUS807 [Vulpes lagopus]